MRGGIPYIAHIFIFFTQGNAKAGLREEESLWRIRVMRSRFSFVSCVFESGFFEFISFVRYRCRGLACGIELKLGILCLYEAEYAP